MTKDKKFRLKIIIHKRKPEPSVKRFKRKMRLKKGMTKLV